jgi:endonuclease YncB( thermonuclease family)
MSTKFLLAIALLLQPAIASAADVTGPAKIRDGDQVVIGSTRIRLSGVDAPSVDQLCLNNSGERWTCGVAARDELVKHAENKSWTCHTQRIDRRGRQVARCEVDGEDIQKWLVKSGWALSYVRFSHEYDEDEKAAREAKAGMWQGAFIAPWDWRVRNKKTPILGAAKAPDNAHAILQASASGSVAPSPDCTIKGNVNGAGECIYHTPSSRWYAQIKMHINKGTRWFCSVDDAERAGCRETKR